MRYTFVEEVKPLYTIKRFSDETYEITKFKRRYGIGLPKPKEESQTYESKMDNSFARARSMIKQYGLCNPWTWFVTLTLDKKKYNRHDLEQFKKDLAQHVRDLRKKYAKLYPDSERLSFVIVPENHKDGAWHMHGLIYGIPDGAISDFVPGEHPQKLIDKGFKRWQDYECKFGFCSLGRIRDQYSTILYTLKYIDKHVEALASMKGKHLYMASRPLNTAENVADVYWNDSELDSYMEYECDFCLKGMVTGKDRTFPIKWDEVTRPSKTNNPDEEIEPWPGLDEAHEQWLKFQALSEWIKLRMELDEDFDPSWIDPGEQISMFK